MYENVNNGFKIQPCSKQNSYIYIYREREREGGGGGRKICRVGKAINIINLIVWWQKINDLLWTAMEGFIRGKRG